LLRGTSRPAGSERRGEAFPARALDAPPADAGSSPKGRGAMTRRGWVLRGLAAIGLAGWLGWPGVAAAQTVKVGAVVPLTGRYAAGGAQVRAGYEIAIEDVNRDGGVSVGGKKMPLHLV